MTASNSSHAPQVGTPSRLAGASWVAIAVALLIVAGSATFLILKSLSPAKQSPLELIALVLVILVVLVSLSVLVGLPLARLWSERRRGRAGARLHTRMVMMFSAVAVVPVIVVAVFAAVTLNLGVESWFSSRVKSALESATNVAVAYAFEHERGIRNDATQIADAIQNDPRIIDVDRKRVNQGLMFAKIEELTSSHQLDATFVIDSRGNLLGSTVPISGAKITWSRSLVPTPQEFAAARTQNVVFSDDAKKGIVHGLVQLKKLNDAYLLVVRFVDPEVLGYYQRLQDVIFQYRNLEESRSNVQRMFGLLYAALSLVIILAAIWLGLWAANRIVRPISRLIGAAERVSEGDLKAQVAVERGDDEIGTLGVAFNRMTSQLDTQRGALVAANQQNEERRRFTETVLAGVSAGVVGVDAEGQITIVNRAAARLMNAEPEELEGQHYSEAVPELAALIRRALQEPVGRSSGEAVIKRAGTTRTLSVQVASEVGRQASGYVVTFDDITDLVSAQRTAAWADVARRIAHEIKNPLTPIQLSAERLKRKYGRAVGDDREVFEQCTDTIIRQVGDIGRMVDEFSSFARMPAPVMHRENAQELMQPAVFLQREAHPEITFETKVPKELVWFECDGRLVTQALTNVIKNATEGIASRVANGDDTPGKISVVVEASESQVAFRVTDNGIGLPAEHRHRLTEPYVTTRAKGTGLGLAIVRKIMEDHGGEILLEDAAEDAKGARVSLLFPLKQRNVREKGVTDEQTRIASRV